MAGTITITVFCLLLRINPISIIIYPCMILDGVDGLNYAQL